MTLFPDAGPWPAWLAPSEQARCDTLVSRFTDAAQAHREGCPTCSSRQPCDELRGMIDAVHADIRKITDPAFASYLESLERKYAPRDWRAT